LSEFARRAYGDALTVHYHPDAREGMISFIYVRPAARKTAVAIFVHGHRLFSGGDRHAAGQELLAQSDVKSLLDRESKLEDRRWLWRNRLKPSKRRYDLATGNQARLPASGELNQQLIADENHRNTMNVPELERRMKDWLDEAYEASCSRRGRSGRLRALPPPTRGDLFCAIFSSSATGAGREWGARRWPCRATNLAQAQRLTVSVLTNNESGMSFGGHGLSDYCLTMEIPPFGEPKKHGLEDGMYA